MKGKIVKIITILLMAVCVVGCGKDKDTEDIAMIKSESQEGDILHAIENAAAQYASEQNLVLKTHNAANQTADDYMVAIQEAVDAGADVVIGYGEEFEVPLYTMQKKNKKVKFLILDGTPRKAEGKRAKIRKNTHAVTYNEAQAGFLAGYAAVKDGYRNLGFLGGEKQDTVALYGSGFVQGAEYAAKELKLKAGEVILRYSYLGTNQLSPSVMASADQWYEDGCELIFTSGGSISDAVIKAAESKEAKVIVSDVAKTSDTQAIVTSAEKKIADCVYQVLDSVYQDSFEGKKEEVLDLSNDGIGLMMDSAKFREFSEEDYRGLVTKILDEEVEVLEEYVSVVNKKEEALSHLTLKFE